MASSSSSEDDTLTIVVSPVELTLVHVSEAKLAAELEGLAKKFDMPLSLLVSSGCLQVFRGKPLELVLQHTDVRTRL